MAPALIKRRSINGRSSPRGYPVGGIRKPSSFRSRRPGIFADKKQVNVLQRGLNVLNKDGGAGGGSGISGSRFDLTSSKKVPMKVAVRVRPLNSRETTANSKEILTVSGPKMLIFDPEREKEDFYFKNQKVKDVTAKKHKNISFAFDNVYNEQSTNAKIYEDIMKPALDTLLTGFNCSVFAYGPTGSGKTYTMLGSEGNPGLTYLTISDLYRRLDGMKEDFHTFVKMSYFEVYNEQVHDLINYTAEPLQIMEVGRGRLTVKNLSEHHPENVDQLFEMLTAGNKNRSQHPTDHNAESSRSHAILQVSINMNEKHSSSEASKKAAKLVMVDLAGSEKGCATGFSGARFQEGSSINKSLLALGKIMETLASGKKAYTYRDSKLTRILKDSLGGNSRTIMIANVSPAAAMYEDTLNTLRYAQKAKKISCDASKNVITVKSCMTEYTRVVDELATKIQKLEKENKKKDEYIEDLLEENRLYRSQRDEARKKVSELELQMYTLESEKDSLELDKQLLEQDKSLLEMEKSLMEADDVGTSPIFRDLKRMGLFPKADETFVQPEGGAVFLQDGSLLLDIIEPHCEWSQDVNGSIRPKLEKLYSEFQIKLHQIKNFKSLLVSTGDVRYGKAVRRTCKKISTIIKDLRSLFKDLICKTIPDAIHAPMDDVYKLKCNDLMQMHNFKIGFRAASGEAKILHNQVSSLTREVLRKESNLVELARLTNTMCNILKHYDHLTPALEEEYEKTIGSFCSPSLQFMGNEEYGLKMHTLFAPDAEVIGSQISDNRAIDRKLAGCGDEIALYKISIESRLKSIATLVGDIPEFDNVNTTFESDVLCKTLAEENMELECGNAFGILNLNHPSYSQSVPPVIPEGHETIGNVLKTGSQSTPNEMEDFLNAKSWFEPDFDEKMKELSGLFDPDLFSANVGDYNSGASTLTTNETVLLAVDGTFTLPQENEDEENVEPGFGFKTYADTVAEIINTHLPECDTETSSPSIGSLSTGRSPSLLIPPKQYKSNLFFPRVSTPVAEAGPSSKPASTGLMKPPLSKQTPFDQKRTELSTFRFAGQLPGNGAPLKVASSHNFKGHSSSVSPPATKGYQMGIGAKPKFGSSSSGGKMPTSKIAPQRKSPYAKSKKAAVSTLRKSCSTSNLQKVRTSVNPQQSKSKPQQQHDKSKWQPK